MLTAMLAVKNIQGGEFDLWAVNVDPDYHEEIRATDAETADEFALLASTQPRVPERVESPLERAIISGLARMDKLALAVALGTVGGLAIFLATITLILKGGDQIGKNLALLSHYFFGYTVSVQGAFIGMAYTFAWGFLFGWLFAYLRNLAIGIFLFFVREKAERSSLRDFVDYI